MIGETSVKGYLKIAEKEDMDFLFALANDKTVRQNSFTTEEIQYEDHKRWFCNLLANEHCRQYLYMIDGKAVGQVRLTVYENTAEIGYSICAEQRGKGYGKEMLLLIQKQAKKDFPHIKRLLAKVKPENAASRKALIRAGFQETHCDSHRSMILEYEEE